MDWTPPVSSLIKSYCVVCVAEILRVGCQCPICPIDASKAVVEIEIHGQVLFV